MFRILGDKRSTAQTSTINILKINMAKNYLFFLILILFPVLFSSCKNKTVKNKIIGSWHSENKKTGLKITAKEFTLNEDGEPIAENYFLKGDTLFTSYEGTAPFTKFVIKDLSDKSLTLVYPDSTLIKFIR